MDIFNHKINSSVLLKSPWNNMNICFIFNVPHGNTARQVG